MTQSNQQHPALPVEWVEKIFTLMACTYGNKFADLWSGQDMQTVKAHWAKKLGGFTGTAIAKAIYSLDKPFPPTLPEFIELCKQAARREESYVSLPPPVEVSKDTAAARSEEVKKIASRVGKNSGNKKWAEELRAAYLRGVKLHGIQIKMASAALLESWSNSEIAIEPIYKAVAA